MFEIVVNIIYILNMITIGKLHAIQIHKIEPPTANNKVI